MRLDVYLHSDNGQLDRIESAISLVLTGVKTMANDFTALNAVADKLVADSAANSQTLLDVLAALKAIPPSVDVQPQIDALVAKLQPVADKIEADDAAAEAAIAPPPAVTPAA